MTQFAVMVDKLPLLSVGLHCVGLNFPVPSTDSHLEGGKKQPVNRDTRTRANSGLAASFSGHSHLQRRKGGDCEFTALGTRLATCLAV